MHNTISIPPLLDFPVNIANIKWARNGERKKRNDHHFACTLRPILLWPEVTPFWSYFETLSGWSIGCLLAKGLHNNLTDSRTIFIQNTPPLLGSPNTKQLQMIKIWVILKWKFLIALLWGIIISQWISVANSNGPRC